MDASSRVVWGALQNQGKVLKMLSRLNSRREQAWNSKKLEVAKGFRLPTVPEEAYKNLQNHLNSYDVGVLIALEKMCLALKSMMLSLMVIERKLSIEECVRLRCDQKFASNSDLFIVALKTSTRKKHGVQLSTTTPLKNVTFALKLLPKHYLFDSLLRTSTRIPNLSLTTLSRIFKLYIYQRLLIWINLELEF